jgi:hypothetical protein
MPQFLALDSARILDYARGHSQGQNYDSLTSAARIPTPSSLFRRRIFHRAVFDAGNRAFLPARPRWLVVRARANLGRVS